jgi:hypothetical protein
MIHVTEIICLIQSLHDDVRKVNRLAVAPQSLGKNGTKPEFPSNSRGRKPRYALLWTRRPGLPPLAIKGLIHRLDYSPNSQGALWITVQRSPTSGRPLRGKSDTIIRTVNAVEGVYLSGNLAIEIDIRPTNRSGPLVEQP